MCPIPDQATANGGGIVSVFLSALIIRSGDVRRLTTFYKEVLGLPLVEADHEGDAPEHYECQIGDVHFAIYPDVKQEGTVGGTRVKYAFAVPSLDTVIARLDGVGIKPRYDPVDRGFALMTAFEDPDGNLVELTQLTSWWLQRLSDRPQQVRDVAFAFSPSS